MGFWNRSWLYKYIKDLSRADQDTADKKFPWEKEKMSIGASLDILEGKTIGFIGYGNQGRAQCLNLIDVRTIWFVHSAVLC